MATSSDEIRSLTGIRGVAAVFIVICHFCVFHEAAGFSNKFFERGYLAVELFFILSGYVMCLSYERTFARGVTLRKYGEFFAKRVGRIYPVYIVLLAIMLLLIGAGVLRDDRVDAVNVLCNLLLIQSWGLVSPIISPSWSVSTEVAAYLLFPFLLLVSTRRSGVALLAALAVTFLVLVATRSSEELNQVYDGVAARHGMLDVAGVSIYPLVRCFGGFMLGMVSYRVAHTRTGRLALGWRHSGDVLAVLLVALLFVPRSDLFVVAVEFALVVSLAIRPSLVGKAMSFGPLYWAGLLSLSIYLLHDPMRVILERPLQSLLDTLHVPHAYTLSLVLPQLAVIPAAMLTYTFVEKPGRDAVRRMFGVRRAPSIAVEPSAP